MTYRSELQLPFDPHPCPSLPHDALARDEAPPSPRPSLPLVLVVDADLRWRRRVARALHSHAIVRTAGTIDAAREHLREAPISGIVLELALAEGSALPLLEELGGSIPALVLSATASVLDASRVSALGAVFASKLEPGPSRLAKLERLAISASRRSDARALLTERLCTAAPLTAAERETLRTFVRIGQRGCLAAELGIAETSVRSRVRTLCRKLGIVRLADVYRLLFDHALAPATPAAARLLDERVRSGRA
jgi:DNA-binding NarL/FixJ family response regulator